MLDHMVVLFLIFWGLFMFSIVTASSVQFSLSVVSYSLRPHGLQHTRLPCLSPTPRACSNCQWCHPTISSSVVPFSSWVNLSQHWGQNRILHWSSPIGSPPPPPMSYGVHLIFWSYSFTKHSMNHRSMASSVGCFAIFFFPPYLLTLDTFLIHASNLDSSWLLLYASLSLVFSSVTQLCSTLCNLMDCSTPGYSVHHQLPNLGQTHVHQVGDAIQPCYLLSSPYPPAFNLSQHQALFQ